MNSEQPDALGTIASLAQRLAGATDANKTALQREYLEAVGHFLADRAGDDRLAFPLLDMIKILEAAQQVPERRENESVPSDRLLAQVCAVIDILVSAGYSLDHACQIVTRQMIARNVRVISGGDARAWRNLQAWRHKMIGIKPEPTWKHYQASKIELMSAYGSRVAEAAAREAIWDRRSLAGKSAA